MMPYWVKISCKRFVRSLVGACEAMLGLLLPKKLMHGELSHWICIHVWEVRVDKMQFIYIAHAGISFVN